MDLTEGPHVDIVRLLRKLVPIPTSGHHAEFILFQSFHLPDWSWCPVDLLQESRNLAQSVDTEHSRCCLQRMNIDDSLRLPDPALYNTGRLSLVVLVQELRVTP